MEDLNATTEPSPTLTTDWNDEGDWCITLLILYSLTCVFGVFGNTLVVLSITIYSKLQTVMNYLLVSLAITDLTVCLWLVPVQMYIVAYPGYWLPERILCNAWLLTDLLMVTSSIWHLCVISLDRYAALTWPLRYRRKSHALVVATVVTPWILALAPSLALFVGSGGFFSDEPLTCSINTSAAVGVFVTFSSFYLPAFIMIVIYIRISCAVFSWRNKISPRLDNEGAGERVMMATRSVNESASQGNPRSLEGRSPARATHESGNAANSYQGMTGVAFHDAREQNVRPVSREDLLSASHASSSFVSKQASDGRASIRATYEPGNTARRRQERTGVAFHDAGVLGVRPGLGGEVGLVRQGPGKSGWSHHERRDIASPHPGDQYSRSVSEGRVHERRGEFPLDAGERSAGRRHRDQTFSRDVTHRTQPRVQKLAGNNTKKEKRATLIAVVVVVTFLLCWGPLHLLLTILVTGADRSMSGIIVKIYPLVICLSYMNSALNPLIYTIFNRNFRDAFKKILLCRFRVHPQSRDRR